MRLSLATKISITLLGVLTLALLSSVVAIRSAYRFESIQATLVAENLASVRAAEELEIALLEQRGYVSSYILDGGNTAWLEQLDQHRKDFDHWLGEARGTARSDDERRILDRLQKVQIAYARKRDEVVSLYDAGHEEAAIQVLLSDVVLLYRQTYDLCEEFIAANQKLVEDTNADVRRQVERITAIVTVMFVVSLALGLALLWLFFRGVIYPLRRIAADVRSASGDGRDQDTIDDELRELGHYVQLLMTNVTETRSDLEHSRTQLAHADKLAAVGKLAASVAHEIRNPLTSVKMWLYSLRRSISQDAELQEKLAIISEEISRLESIVRNFLEFARPPQMNLRSRDMGEIIGKTIEFMQYRMDDQRISVIRQDEPDLPQVLADTEQLKQVFLNLINNAVEAMPDGGEIRIAASRAWHGGRDMLVVRLSDTGPGMPEKVQQHIFEPFFTTKEDGTGLGLCIAASIMARHAGLLELESSGPTGTRWTVWIPATESTAALQAS